MHLDKGKYYGLDPVAKRIWQLVEEPKSINENYWYFARRI
jgi:hypothetical protein